MYFPRLVMFSVFDFLQTASTWRRHAKRQPRSMMRKLGLKFGSGPSQRMGPLALTPSLHSDLVHGATSRYIRGVSFSPDGKLLATGADDAAVRVSSGTFVSAIVIVVIMVFEANAQHSTFFDTLDLGYRQEANLQNIQGSH